MSALMTTQQGGPVMPWEDPQTLKKRMNRMVELMKDVMKEDVHFGKIPGCKQNTLLQPGSQLLSLTFRIGHKPGNIEDLSSSDEIRYRVTDEVFDQQSGIVIGYGIGECSSNEDKYAWRRATTDQEYENTAEDRRRIKYVQGRGQDQVWENKQVRTNPSDVANTVLKMARKRANVNGTIEALAASEIFTQDLEDLPEGMDIGDREPASSKPKMNAPTEKAPESSTEKQESPDDDTRKKNKWISSGQEKRLYAICKTANVDHYAVREYVRATHKQANAELWNITWAKGKDGKSEYDRICETVEKKPEFFLKYQQVQTTAGNGPQIDPAAETANVSPEAGSQETAPEAEEPGPSPRDEFELGLKATIEQKFQGPEIDNAIKAILDKFGILTLSQVPEAKFNDIMAAASVMVR